jgi:hypothetical protein
MMESDKQYPDTTDPLHNPNLILKLYIFIPFDTSYLPKTGKMEPGLERAMLDRGE